MHIRYRPSAFSAAIVIGATLMCGVVAPTSSSSNPHSKVLAGTLSNPFENPSQHKPSQNPSQILARIMSITYQENREDVFTNKERKDLQDSDSIWQSIFFLCTWNSARKFEHAPVHKPPEIKHLGLNRTCPRGAHARHGGSFFIPNLLGL